MNVLQASSSSAPSRQHQNKDGSLCCSSILPASKDSLCVVEKKKVSRQKSKLQSSLQ